MIYDKQKVIDTAFEWVGYMEKKNGDLNYLKSKKLNVGYNNYTWFGYTMHNVEPTVMDYPAAWCDCFVDFCFYSTYGEDAAKYLLCGEFNDYTPSSADLYKQMDRWFSEPQVGDQIFFKNDTRICHTGIVYAVDDDTVYTVEGNTNNTNVLVPNGGAVCKKSYPIHYSKIAGYGRPRYGQGENYMFTVKTIRHGDHGPDVYLMQRILRGEGYRMKNKKLLGLSKLFGEQTEFALRTYQSDHGLEVDGICGPRTWASLIGLPSE